MSGPIGPVFDESLAAVSRELHVVEWALAAVVGAAILCRWLERRGRARWALVPTGTVATSRAPYRSYEVIAGFMDRAPPLVRVASFGSLAFGHFFAPLIVMALVKYPFDGIAIPLVPGMALALLNWSCAWMLLRRSPLAPSAARSGAVGSLMANIGLIAIAGVHFAYVELQRRDGIEHACSSSVTFVVIVFAVCSVVQALLMMAALRAHRSTLAWAPVRVERVAEVSAAEADEEELAAEEEIDDVREVRRPGRAARQEHAFRRPSRTRSSRPPCTRPGRGPRPCGGPPEPRGRART